MIETEEKRERVVLFAVSTRPDDDTEASLDELAELCDTAGADAAGRLVQNLETASPATYLGKGKVEELKALVLASGADGVVCDDELTPAQLRNLEDALEVKVMDRTMVILDIFAAHAVTSEGKIQVELAQLRYRAIRLSGFRDYLSRQGGGIGTRGPGEKKLEVDRRRIHERIGQLKSELREVERHREVTRRQRKKDYALSAAIVGYTNAGKSTLLNTLTGAGVLAENKLFATLDPTTRSLRLPGGQNVLLTDTVGFIRKLPHNLVEAFRSTLEEAKYSDIIIHVADVTNPRVELEMQVVYETLRDLGIGDRPVITVFNKTDRPGAPMVIKDLRADYTVRLSAKTGEGVPELLDILAMIIRDRRVYLEERYDYREAGTVGRIRKYGQMLSEEYRDDGIYVKAYVPAELFGEFLAHGLGNDSRGKEEN
ncbi:GTPase HflX [Clostridium vitabionis]|uniref:GTPase HflX n=1 Tax=Clostridium vitabionis TaxID=2784388 RepID=UPI00188D88B4|nr:GTPase HflX [Clostridium vitabionis]